MLSIIICTLNEEHYLPMLLDSIQVQQTNFEYEILVIDAGSTDNTAAVVTKYQAEDYEHKAPENLEKAVPFFRGFKNGVLRFVPTERGIAAQRNVGATQAQYEKLLFLDADVVLPKHFLQNAISEIIDNQILVAGTSIFAAEKHLGFRLVYWIYSNTYYKVVRWFNPVIHGCSIFVTKTIHNKIGGFKQGIMFEDFKYGSDAAAFYRPRLLRSTYIRTSARRFYNASPRSVWELVRGAAKSFFKSGIKQDEFKAFHELSGNHEKPQY
jgi:glycosyltransferase involved in cell wall biosynthesis